METKENNLCADISYLSLNHAGEQLCGDHVEVVEQDSNSLVIVMSDGLGSGVKANILSVLTSKIIATMLAAGLQLEDAIETLTATLPVCSVRGMAYSTFTIIRLVNNERAEIIQYDNPRVVLLRNGHNLELPYSISEIEGKKIYHSDVFLEQNDLFILFSDGVEHAGVGGVYNYGWKREDIIKYMEIFWNVGFAAKTLTTILLDKVGRLYQGIPADDATVCTVRICEQDPFNLPSRQPNPDDCEKVIAYHIASSSNDKYYSAKLGSNAPR